MQYAIVSFTHKNTDLATREKLSFGSEALLEEYLKRLLEHKSINEAIILSTCNRVEIIVSSKDPFASTDYIFSLLAQHSGIGKEELEGRADLYEDNGAIHHLFSVASSLDSLVVGESQITGQLKDAFRFSFDKGYCGQKLGRAIHYAFRCAAQVRKETNISENPVSVASAAVAQAKAVLGELGGNTAIVVGAGEMSRLACRHLASSGCNIIIVNRNQGSAEKIASELGGMAQVMPFKDLGDLINRYRLLFSATAASHPIITRDMVEKRGFVRYWFDLAVPRDIEEPEDGTIHLFSVDDLKMIVNTNIALREEQAKKAYGIVGRFTMDFFRWLQTLSVEPLIKEIREQARKASLRELERAIKKGFIPEEMYGSVMKVIHQSFNAFLHQPTVNLRDIAEKPSADTIVEAMKFVFDVEKEVKLLEKYKCEHHIKG